MLERLRRREHFVQREHQLVARKRCMQSLGPVGAGLFRQLAAGEGAVRLAHFRAGIVVFHGLHALVQDFGWIFPQHGRRVPWRCPNLGFVVLAHRRHRLRVYAEEPRREVAGGVRLLAIHDGGGGGYAGGVCGIRSAERPQSPHQARGFCAERAGEGMRFVEHEVVQPRVGEQFHVLLAREQQFQLLHVGEQDARLTARRPHRFPRAQLFRGIDRLAGGVASRAFHAGAVVRPGGTRRQPNAGHLRLPFRRLPDVQPERDAGTGQQPAQTHELILRQRVHRIDDHGADARRRSFVPQPQTLADDGIEKALRLAGAGAGGNQSGSARGDGADGLFLVAVEGGEALRNTLPEVGVQQAIGHQRFHRGAFAEGAGKADVGPFEQGRAAGLVQRE